MADYDELVRQLREALDRDYTTPDGWVPIGLTYRLSQAADAIEELLEKFEQLPRWISVKDVMPEETKDVLLLFEHNQAVGFWNGVGWSINCADDFYTSLDTSEPYPTHWMPLPSAEGLNDA